MLPNVFRKKSRKIKLCAAGLLCTLAVAWPLYAVDELEQKMKELDEINKQIAKYDDLYKQKQKEEKSVLRDIKTLENNIDVLEGDINVLKGQINTTEGQINVTKQDIEKAIAFVNQRTEYLNDRLRSIYQEGKVNYIEVLLQSTSLTDFLTRFDLLEKIAENDVKLLSELKTVRQDLEEKKALLEDKSDQFTNLKGQKENKQTQMETQTKQKNTMLKSIQEQMEEYKKATAELEEVQQEIDAFIKEWQAKHPDAYMGAGTMIWPVPGYRRISSGYGYRIHPIYKVRSFHAGIDIPAPRGTPVVAAEKGKVLFMGNKGAYGRAIILDHGGNTSTQYSHLDRYASISIGDVVNKGQTIGYVDSSGWSTGHHLDFILRINGDPVNPVGRLK